MIKLAEILEYKQDIRFKRLSELLKEEHSDLYDKLLYYRENFYYLWDILNYGEETFKKYLTSEEFDILVEKLAEYGLKFGDPIVSSCGMGFFEYGIQSKLTVKGLDALDECSLVDFVEGSEAMEFINDEVERFINNNISCGINCATDSEELRKIEDAVESFVNAYKSKVLALRNKFYAQLSPEDALALQKASAKRTIQAKLGEIKHFHHKANPNGEHVHFNNPYNVDEGLLN